VSKLENVSVLSNNASVLSNFSVLWSVSFLSNDSVFSSVLQNFFSFVPLVSLFE
jgi:hypothetical protein